MKPRTREHIETARQHRAVALHLFGEDEARQVSLEWATIAAFYAAVHLVNAYLRERLDLEPRDHTERTRLVSTVSVLRPIANEYDSLLDAAYLARYRTGYRLNRRQAQALISHLTVIESSIAEDLASA